MIAKFKQLIFGLLNLSIFVLSLSFIVLSILVLIEKPIENVNNFCELECDGSKNFHSCMDSCFRSIGGAEALSDIVLFLGFIGLIVFSLYLIKFYKFISCMNKKSTADF